jgi:mannose-6-phosphate isomerase-like protein (cupin superfamily)
MKPAIIRFDGSREYFTDELCHINELSNHDGDADVSVAQARVTPGTTTRLHRLKDTTERYVILEGQGVVEIGDLPATTVTRGDVVLIPPMCPQRITNTGSGELLFLAICSPRFRQECYEDIEPLS